MPTNVYKEGGFVVIDQSKFSQVMRVPLADFDSSQIGNTDSVEMYEKNLPATHRRVEIFSDILDEGGNPVGATVQDVLMYLSSLSLAPAPPLGAVDATLVSDNIGLSRKVQFDCKYTGFYIDLSNPDSGSWPDFTFNIEQVNLLLNTSPVFTIADFAQNYSDIKSTKELAEFLNCLQNYFYFTDVGPSYLGIMAGKLPVSEFSQLNIDADGEILEYSSGSLQYQVATEQFSTQDKIILNLEQNAQKQNAPKGLAVRREEKAFPVSGLLLSVANLNPYREELIIKNNSTNNLYIGYGPSTSSTDYTFLLEPSKLLRLTAGHTITAAWESGSTSGTVLITESI